MLTLFQKGGPIMWPLLVCSLIALTVVVERVIFILTERKRRSPQAVREILGHVEHGDNAAALRAGEGSPPCRSSTTRCIEAPSS